jgi:hypothetical protein
MDDQAVAVLINVFVNRGETENQGGFDVAGGD